MPVPVIAAGVAAVAARLAAKKAAQQLAKKAASKTAQIAKNSVVKKPARKPVGNPPNDTKMFEDYIGSVSRGAPSRGGSAGKAKARRVVNSKITKNTVPSAKEPARRPEIPAGRTVKINSAKTTRVVRVNPKKVTSSSTTKKTTRKALPSKFQKVKSEVRQQAGLETRGANPTTRERINRARDLQWDKAEKSYEAGNEMRYTGLVSSDKGMVAARGAGKKNMRKRDAIRSEANKNLPIQINSARPFKSTGADPLKANNARALKAANRTRSGKSAKKK